MRLNTFLWGGDCLSLLWKDFFRALPWFRFSMKWLLNKKSWNISEESHFWQLYWIMHKNPGILQHCLIFTSYCVKANTWCASYDAETSYPQKDRQNIERWSSFLKRWPECLLKMFFLFLLFHINDRWTSLCKSKAEESYWKWELTSWWQFSWEKNESKVRKYIFTEKPCINLPENSLSLVSEAFVYLPYRVILKYRIVIVIVEVNVKVLPFEYWPVTPSCFR